jgi:hypothetical protein
VLVRETEDRNIHANDESGARVRNTGTIPAQHDSSERAWMLGVLVDARAHWWRGLDSDVWLQIAGFETRLRRERLGTKKPIQ